MKTRLKALALAAVLGATGCAEDRGSLEIRAVCAPTDQCSFSDTCDAQYIGEIQVVAPSVTAPLYLFVEVANQLENNEDPATGRVNTNDAHVTGIILELEGANSGSGQLQITNQLVPAEGSAVVGIPIGYGTTVGPTTAQIQLVGYYDSDREFETPQFPVNYSVVASIPACATAGDIDVCPGFGNQLPRACATP